MQKQKSILIVEQDITIRKAISLVLAKLDLKVFEAPDGVEAMEIVRNFKLDLVIMNMFLSPLSSVDLIKNIKSSQDSTEIIVLSDVVNQGVFDKMRGLGVFRLFKIPFELDEVRDAVLRGLGSPRLERLHIQQPQGEIYPKDFIHIIVAHSDEDLFQKVKEIGDTRDYAIDHAKDQSSLIKLSQIGTYDILVTTLKFLKSINAKSMQTLVNGQCKPLVFLLNDSAKKISIPAQLVEENTTTLPAMFSDAEFLNTLDEALPRYLDSREKLSQQKSQSEEKIPFSERLRMGLKKQRKKLFSPVFGFYLILILIAGLLGFWVNIYLEKEDERKNKEDEALRKFQQYNSFDRLNDLRRGNNY